MIDLVTSALNIASNAPSVVEAVTKFTNTYRNSLSPKD